MYHNRFIAHFSKLLKHTATHIHTVITNKHSQPSHLCWAVVRGKRWKQRIRVWDRMFLTEQKTDNRKSCAYSTARDFICLTSHIQMTMIVQSFFLYLLSYSGYFLLRIVWFLGVSQFRFLQFHLSEMKDSLASKEQSPQQDKDTIQPHTSTQQIQYRSTHLSLPSRRVRDSTLAPLHFELDLIRLFGLCCPPKTPSDWPTRTPPLILLPHVATYYSQAARIGCRYDRYWWGQFAEREERADEWPSWRGVRGRRPSEIRMKLWMRVSKR